MNESSYYMSSSDNYGESASNNNIYHHTVIRYTVFGDFCVLEGKFKGHTNFDGHKTMILRGKELPPEDLDPHFFNDSRVIARFVPTEEGWRLASGLACAMATFA